MRTLRHALPPRNRPILLHLEFPSRRNVNYRTGRCGSFVCLTFGDPNREATREIVTRLREGKLQLVDRRIEAPVRLLYPRRARRHGANRALQLVFIKTTHQPSLTSKVVRGLKLIANRIETDRSEWVSRLSSGERESVTRGLDYLKEIVEHRAARDRSVKSDKDRKASAEKIV